MKLHLLITIFIISLLLSACAPTSYVYLKADAVNSNKIDKVLIMIEYLSLKQGFDEHWDFDENIHLKNQDELFDLAAQMLLEKGYVVSEKSLKTSGLVMNREFYLDHYLNNKKQEQLISPPYIVRSINLQDDTIQAIEYLLAEINAPISRVMADYRSHVKNNYKAQTDNLNLSEKSAILVLQVYQPRKSLLTHIELGFGHSNFGSNVGFGSYQPNPTSEAYLIHIDSGDVLWSNKTTLITDRNQQKFFAELPNVLLH